ncbi:uncharacterized transporter Esbp6p [[Candida] railenensis]|uniref:Uncharacterized transporter Esbp6p n=1 Tax=[Candida] railenensis TaxID=45579 RepID=A0A9P0QS68_9ASCO|nr:uncharacterized transporter Esbp6p [[Candida] railenensis]
MNEKMGTGDPEVSSLASTTSDHYEPYMCMNEKICTGDPEVSSLESTTSDHYEPYMYALTQVTFPSKSHHGSDLSRIISGIREDQELSADYLPTVDAEYRLAKRLTHNEEPKTVRSLKSNDSERKSGGEPDLEQHQEGCDEDDDGQRKDEGFAWVVAICTMLAVFSTWGASAGYGVFLSYYVSSDAFSGASQYDYALIGGMNVCFAQLLAPVCVLSYRVFGPYYTSYFGIALQTLGYILASFATKRWQLYCTQGFIVGISFSFVYLPGTLMLPTWFDKRRATAMGIAFSGSGLGGVFFSLVIRQLISVTGDQRWALRMCAFVTGFVAIIACSMMKPRNYKPLPLKTTLTRAFIYSNVRTIFSTNVFKDYALLLLGLWYGLTCLAYILVLFSVSSYAISVGLTAFQGSIITAVLNASQTIGRPASGFLADKFGRFNFTIASSVYLCLLVLAFWINATSFGSLMGFSILIGFSIGIGNVFCQSLASDILNDMDSLPAAWSGLNIIVSFFCIGAEVAALALKKDGASNEYLNTQIFGGVCFFASAMLLCIMRENVVKKRLMESLERERKLYEERSNFNGYLRDNAAVKGEEIKAIETRIDRYKILVQTSSLKIYFIRLFYPIKV